MSANVKIWVLISFIFISCGSRKVNKQIEKSKEEKNTSVLINEKVKDSIYQLNDEKLRLKLEKTSFKFEPIDNAKPYFVNGVKYENVKVVNQSEKSDFKQDSKQIKFELTQLERTTILLQEEIKELEKRNKQIERYNTKLFVIIFIILLLLLIAFIYYYYRQYKGKKDILTKTFNL